MGHHSLPENPNSTQSCSTPYHSWKPPSCPSACHSMCMCTHRHAHTCTCKHGHTCVHMHTLVHACTCTLHRRTHTLPWQQCFWHVQTRWRQGPPANHSGSLLLLAGRTSCADGRERADRRRQPQPAGPGFSQRRLTHYKAS